MIVLFLFLSGLNASPITCTIKQVYGKKCTNCKNKQNKDKRQFLHFNIKKKHFGWYLNCETHLWVFAGLGSLGNLIVSGEETGNAKFLHMGGCPIKRERGFGACNFSSSPLAICESWPAPGAAV